MGVWIDKGDAPCIPKLTAHFMRDLGWKYVAFNNKHGIMKEKELLASVAHKGSLSRLDFCDLYYKALCKDGFYNLADCYEKRAKLFLDLLLETEFAKECFTSSIVFHAPLKCIMTLGSIIYRTTLFATFLGGVKNLHEKGAVQTMESLNTLDGNGYFLAPKAWVGALDTEDNVYSDVCAYRNVLIDTLLHVLERTHINLAKAVWLKSHTMPDDFKKPKGCGVHCLPEYLSAKVEHWQGGIVLYPEVDDAKTTSNFTHLSKYNLTALNDYYSKNDSVLDSVTINSAKNQWELKSYEYDSTSAKLCDDLYNNLHEETRVGVLVKGTNGYAEYLVAGIGKDVSIAFRYKKGILSVRLEGKKQETKLPVVFNGVKSFSKGFLINGLPYWSVHVKTDVHAATILLNGLVVSLDLEKRLLVYIEGAVHGAD